MSYKAILIDDVTGRNKTVPTVEIYEVQRAAPTRTIHPSEDFRRVIEQSPADVREAFREVMMHEE